MDLSNVEVKKDAPEPKKAAYLYGFGGWLYVFAIGLAFKAYQAYMVLSQHYLGFGSKDYQLVLDPSSSSYNSLWKPFLTVEILGNILIIVFIALIAFFCYKQRALFKKLSIIFISLNFLFILFEFFMMLSLNSFYVDPIYTPDQIITPILQATIYAAIWIPYFMFSKRVKNTFLK